MHEITCAICLKPVPSQATTCPHCGYGPNEEQRRGGDPVVQRIVRKLYGMSSQEREEAWTAALKANARALREGYCTVANAYDIKCGQHAEYLLVAGWGEQEIREPVCYAHVAEEIEQAVAVYKEVRVRAWSDTGE